VENPHGLVPGFERGLKGWSPGAALFHDMVCGPLILAIHALPLLTVAALGGWLAKRYDARSLRPEIATA